MLVFKDISKEESLLVLPTTPLLSSQEVTTQKACFNSLCVKQNISLFLDMYGYWKTIPSIIEGIHCYRFCVVNQDFLWTTSLNIIQIYNEEFMPIDVSSGMRPFLHSTSFFCSGSTGANSR